MSKYYIKLKNITLLSFFMEQNIGLEILKIEIINKNTQIYPPQLQDEVNEDTIISFINSRIIPKNRAFVEDILRSYNLTLNDKKGVIDVSKGLSLTDDYWIVQDQSLDFDKYNLFDNEFSDVLSLVAFTGYSSKVKGLFSSPELSTNGMLPKTWRRINNEVFLYKGSTSYLGAINTGMEPYSEYYAAQIAETLGYNHVKYNLDIWKDQVVSICPLFTTKDISYVPIGLVIKSGGIKSVFNYIKELGFQTDLSNLLLFDAITANQDRHFGNFGLLRDNNTGKYIGLAPIFDNGESLLSKALPSDFENDIQFNILINSNEYKYSYYNASYEAIIKEYCTKEQIVDLRKLLTFKFIRNDKINLPENRLTKLEKFIQTRAREYIEILSQYNK